MYVLRNGSKKKWHTVIRFGMGWGVLIDFFAPVAQ